MSQGGCGCQGAVAPQTGVGNCGCNEAASESLSPLPSTLLKAPELEQQTCGNDLPKDGKIYSSSPNLHPKGRGLRPGAAGRAAARRLLFPGCAGEVEDRGDICLPIVLWRRAGRPRLLDPTLPTREEVRASLKNRLVLVPGGPTLGDPSIQYRAVEFTVPALWYDRWLAEYRSLEGSNEGGTWVGSVEETLEGVWSDALSAFGAWRGLGDEEIDAVLGCYNLESVADRSMFWREDLGSHREAWRMIVRLMVAYSDGIRDEFQPEGGAARQASRCEGLGEFVRSVMRGYEATNSYGRSCTQTVHFDNKDHRFLHRAVVRCETTEAEEMREEYMDPAKKEKDDYRYCGRWYNKDRGEAGSYFDREWEQWEAGWDSASRTYQGPGNHPYDPNTGVGSLAYGGGFMMNVSPILLAWAGFTADRIMHRARIAWDYARFSGDETYRTHARRLGSYALSTLLPLGETLIHEVGHTYVGGGHCLFGCCFQSAALAWHCHVRGALGLPLALYTRDSSNAYYTSGDGMESSMTRRGTLHHEFGGNEVRLRRKTGGGGCDSTSETTDWWLSEGVHEIDTSRGAILKRVDSEGHLCWTCTIDEAGVPGASSDYCLRRAWQTFDARVNVFTGDVVSVQGVQEWTLARPCAGAPDLSNAASAADYTWCWRST